MRIPKRYGDSKLEGCPFCKRQATTVSEEGVPVCIEHKNASMPELKCLCGKGLEMRKGKFGVFFHCMRCGNLNAKRVYEMNTVVPYDPSKRNSSSPGPTKAKPASVREVTIRADDPLYFD